MGHTGGRPVKFSLKGFTSSAFSSGETATRKGAVSALIRAVCGTPPKTSAET
jgi:hypothetical protein